MGKVIEFANKEQSFGIYNKYIFANDIVEIMMS